MGDRPGRPQGAASFSHCGIKRQTTANKNTVYRRRGLKPHSSWDLLCGEPPPRCHRWVRTNARTHKHAHNYSLRGSNPRPMAHKTIALTTELREPTVCPTTRKCKPRHQATMTPAGLEPAIPGPVGRCIIHWALGPSKRTRGIANNRKRNTKQPHHRRHQMIQTQCATATPSRQTHLKPARREASATHCLFSLVGRAPAQ